MSTRVAAVGVSHWHSVYDAAYLHALNRMDDVRIVGVQDERVEIAVERARLVGDPPTFADYHAMLAQTRPDFVLALGRHDRMAAVAEYLVDADYPFLMEKPMGISAAEVERIAAKAESRSSFAAVPFGLRNHPFAIEARRMAEAEAFGPLSHLYIRSNHKTSARYAAWDSQWMLERAAGGGCLRNLAPHAIDLFLHLSGEDAEVIGAQVSARALGEAVEDYATILLRSAGGVLGTLEVGNTFPNSTGSDREWKIAGRDAVLIFRDGVLVRVTRDEKKVWAGEPDEHLSTTILRQTLSCWRRGERPPSDVVDCLRTVRIIDRAHEVAARASR